MEYDEAKGEWLIKESMQPYCIEVGSREDYGNWSVKCKLCKNAKNEPMYFDEDHFNDEKHRKNVNKRDSKVKNLYLKNLLILKKNLSTVFPKDGVDAHRDELIARGRKC